MSRMLTSFVEIHGDRSQGDDKSIVCGIGQLATQTVVVIGQERGRTSNERNDGRTSPEGFRKAQRALRLAAKFGIPVITLIDTPGPDESIEAELHGLGNAISSNISLMSSLSVPSIAVVIGEGGSAGALAFGVADRVLMLENAIYTTISPEDAAELIYRDEERADEAAESLRLTARDCLEFNIIDQIIPEPPGGSHTDPDEAARQLRRILIREIADLQAVSKHRNIARRYRKFRKMGEYSSRFGAAVTREVDALQGFVASNVRRITRRQRRPSDDEDWDVQALIESSEAGSQSDDL
jgi:acetyl-CoA carboxylase carboxyl transferase alpha subunit